MQQGEINVDIYVTQDYKLLDELESCSINRYLLRKQQNTK